MASLQGGFARSEMPAFVVLATVSVQFTSMPPKGQTWDSGPETSRIKVIYDMARDPQPKLPYVATSLRAATPAWHPRQFRVAWASLGMLEAGDCIL